MLNKDVGLVLGIDNEIVQLSKHKKGWHELFTKINIKYKTKENFEHYCYLNYMGIDAQQMFIIKVKELETI